MNCVCQHSKLRPLAAEHNNPREIGHATLGDAEKLAQVNDGEHLAAQVDDSKQESWSSGNWRAVRQTNDLTYVTRFDRVSLPGQPKGNDFEHLASACLRRR